MCNLSFFFIGLMERIIFMRICKIRLKKSQQGINAIIDGFIKKEVKFIYHPALSIDMFNPLPA
jgi:hypothetical protein